MDLINIHAGVALPRREPAPLTKEECESFMVLLETTATCPLGLAALIALEGLGRDYALRVRDEGHFILHYGAPGPRLVVEGDAMLGAAATARIVAAHLEAGRAGPTIRGIEEQLRMRVGPALRRFVRGEETERPAALTSLRAELTAVEAQLSQVRSLSLDEPLLAPLLTPLARLFNVLPTARSELPTLAATIDAVAASEAVGRARARLAATAPSAVVSPDDVLTFWFGAPIVDEQDALRRVERWFRGTPSFDVEVRARFAPTVEAALLGTLDDWATTPRGRLALVLVLDQLTRNVYRGDARSWAGDARALELCTEGLAAGDAAALSWMEALFLRMPLLHAEQEAAVARALAAAREAAANAPAPLARVAAAQVEQAEKYLAVVRRFGRYPFRNATMGRESSTEELAFLVTFEGPPRALSEVRAAS